MASKGREESVYIMHETKEPGLPFLTKSFGQQVSGIQNSGKVIINVTVMRTI